MPSTARREASLVRGALLIWSLVGLAILGWVGLKVLDSVQLAVAPLVLAPFPSAVLAPVCDRLTQRLPPAAAAGITLAGFVTILGGTLWLLGWLLLDEVPAVADALEDADADVATFVADRFDVAMPDIDDALDQAQDWASGQELGQAGRSFAFATLEVASSSLLILVSMFFYLKDRDRMFRFVVELAPSRSRAHVAEVGRRVWDTLGGTSGASCSSPPSTPSSSASGWCSWACRWRCGSPCSCSSVACSRSSAPSRPAPSPCSSPSPTAGCPRPSPCWRSTSSSSGSRATCSSPSSSVGPPSSSPWSSSPR